jgi:hypothetical protein
MPRTKTTTTIRTASSTSKARRVVWRAFTQSPNIYAD